MDVALQIETAQQHSNVTGRRRTAMSESADPVAVRWPGRADHRSTAGQHAAPNSFSDAIQQAILMQLEEHMRRWATLIEGRRDQDVT